METHFNTFTILDIFNIKSYGKIIQKGVIASLNLSKEHI